MKVTKPIKILVIIAMGALLLAVIANVAINLIITNQLPKIIESKNDTAYDLVYKDINFSIFSNSLSVEHAELKPKKNVSIKKDIDFFGKMDIMFYNKIR